MQGVILLMIEPPLLFKTELQSTSCSSSHDALTAFSLLVSWEFVIWESSMRSQPREGWGQTVTTTHLQCVNQICKDMLSEKRSVLIVKQNTARRFIPVEDHSGETGLGEDHFSNVELSGGLQASTLLACIKQLSTLHVPHSHCAGQTKHRRDREEGESGWGRDGPRDKGLNKWQGAEIVKFSLVFRNTCPLSP